MLIIRHRVNTVSQIKKVPPGEGVEIDVREHTGRLEAVHDPFQRGEKLERLLRYCGSRWVIFNVKCDGLESILLGLARRYRISNFFLLDVANPTLVRLARKGVRQIAVRYSEYEPLAFALAFAGKVDWVWIDCFKTLPLDVKTYRLLRRHFKMCLVSPELQGHPRRMIRTFRRRLRDMPVDAVCTDFGSDWEI